MKKVLGVTFGGLQKKLILLVLIVFVLTVAVFAILSHYQYQGMAEVEERTRGEQQEAISQTSTATMQRVMDASLAATTVLRANVADNDFSEVVNNVNTLQSMAEELLSKRDSIIPAEVSPPDPSQEGIAHAHVLVEEGVDYTQSEYIDIVAHMSGTMIAMYQSSDKIESCYIGLADGTHLGVDDQALNKLDENGDPIPFPVRERPWYVGAIEEGGLYFTGIVEDAYSGKLMVTYSAPVVVGGETLGVVGIDIVLENMMDVVDSSNSEGGAVYVVNDGGEVIIASKDNGLFSGEELEAGIVDNIELSQFVDSSLAGTTELTVFTIGGKEYYMAGSPMETIGWAVISAVDKELTEEPGRAMLEEFESIGSRAAEESEDNSVKIWNTVIIILGLMFILGLAAAMLAARGIVRPITAMTKDIIRCGRTGILFKVKDDYRTNDEIELLAETFEDLSKKRAHYIKEITAITKEKERVNTELKMASQIQNAMLPHIFPPFPERTEFDIYATMDPAREVGGDFFDFFMIDEDHLGIIMADVSGKGVPAALFMMNSKVTLQNCAMQGRSAAEILSKTNDALCSNDEMEMFVTVWIGILEISTGRITAANAGHEYPVLMKNGRFDLLKDKHGFVLGGMQGVKYKEYEIQMDPGDRLFLYTDGVPEATDEDLGMFGVDRMLEALNREPDAQPEQILKNVRKAVDGFVKEAEQFDDLTMLCLEYRGNAGSGTEKA